MDTEAPAGSLAILFADITGSTVLYETLGDAQALRLVTDCLATLTKSVHKFGGKIVKTVGDEIMCSFAGADAAILAASDMQSRLDRHAGTGAAQAMSVRVGIAYGQIIEDNNDIFGDTVNLCARLVALANPWQILTTRASVDALPAYLRATCRLLYALDVKGKAEQVTLFEVIWKDDANLTMLAGAAPRPAEPARLRLRYRDYDVALTPAQGSLSIGRDATSDIVVLAHSASRQHAKIVARPGKFTLVDQSTNGTFLETDSGTIHLRHEEAILIGAGRIGLGSDPAKSGEVLEYRVEGA